MNSPHLRPFALWALTASLLASGLLASSAPAGTVPTDLRVVNGSARTLADVRQYTDTTAIPTSPSAKCFFGGAGGSGKPFTSSGPTALGAVADAAQSVGGLNPLSITDEYSFGLGVCGFGGFTGDAGHFWEVRVDHKALQKAGDRVQVSSGDDVLWHLIPNPMCDFNPPYTCQPTPPELELRAPASAKPGQPFTATVFEYNDNGFIKPAAGAVVTGGAAPTDAAGQAQVTLAATGVLGATRAGSTASRQLGVCVSARPKSCPSRRGLQIFGSDLRDAISGTPGPDTIAARGGDDVIGVRKKGKDRVGCGAGKDIVRADRADKVNRSTCEKIKRPRKRSAKK